MARNLPAIVSIAVAAAAFVIVVLWPSNIGPPAKVRPPVGAGDNDGTHPADASGTITLPADSPRSANSPTSKATSKPLSWHRPRFTELRTERHRLVKRTISHPRDGRLPIADPRVIEAMRNVPRHRFVPATERSRAYADHPLPIGHRQTISQPYIVALMTEALRLRPGAKVLEIGTGSGYQAAVLTELTPHVFTIEISKPLQEMSRKRLIELGYKTIRFRHGDGYAGWAEHAPFDAVIVTCAAEHMPSPLFEQLAPGGRMVIPIGRQGAYQKLDVITKDPITSAPRYQTICGVSFVPMTGPGHKR